MGSRTGQLTRRRECSGLTATGTVAQGQVQKSSPWSCASLPYAYGALIENRLTVNVSGRPPDE